MTEAKLKKLARQWAKRLGLDHIDITVVIRTLDESDNKAECQASENYRFAEIAFQPWMIGKGDPPDAVTAEEVSDEWVEKTLVHELLHVAVVPLKRVWTALEDQIHPDAWSLFDDQIRNGEEQVVDALAVALTRSWAR